MTSAERTNPDLIDTSRRNRIAKGSGTQAGEVAQLVTQFKAMRRLIQGMGDGAMQRVKKKTKKGQKKGKGGGRVTAKGTAPNQSGPFTMPGMSPGSFDPLADQIEKLGLDLPELN